MFILCYRYGLRKSYMLCEYECECVVRARVFVRVCVFCPCMFSHMACDGDDDDDVRPMNALAIRTRAARTAPRNARDRR